MQDSSYSPAVAEDQKKAKINVHKHKYQQISSSASLLKSELPAQLQRAMDFLRGKGASGWLTALPVEEFGYALLKGAFRDALALRYGWHRSTLQPIACPCGKHFSVDHALSYVPKRGDPCNEIRELTANPLSQMCHDVSIEPGLQPITGEALSGASSNSQGSAHWISQQEDSGGVRENRF